MPTKPTNLTQVKNNEKKATLTDATLKKIFRETGKAVREYQKALDNGNADLKNQALKTVEKSFIKFIENVDGVKSPSQNMLNEHIKVATDLITKTTKEALIFKTKHTQVQQDALFDRVWNDPENVQGLKQNIQKIAAKENKDAVIDKYVNNSKGPRGRSEGK